MTIKYAWILDASFMPYIDGKAGVSPSYVVPASHAPKDPRKLAGADALIFLRGANGDMIFASMFISQVERFEDGLSAGDYLLATVASKSFRTVRSYERGSPNFIFKDVSSLQFGFHEISDKTFQKAREKVLTFVPVRLNRPGEKLLTTIGNSHSGRSIPIEAKKAIGIVTGLFALENVWGSGSKPKLPPFANFAYRALELYAGEKVAADFVPFLRDEDPLSHKSPEDVEVDLRKEKNRMAQIPCIDLGLKPIDPNLIYARSFVARDPGGFDLDVALAKTEHAEKHHQDMLRDIAVYILERGLTPMQSSSVDLFVKTIHGRNVTFEIKTTTPDNVLGQTAKGLFQLGCYAGAIEEEGMKNDHLVLILEETGSLELDAYVSRITERFGIVSLYYRKKKPWPERLEGLDSTLGQ